MIIYRIRCSGTGPYHRDHRYEKKTLAKAQAAVADFATHVDRLGPIAALYADCAPYIIEQREVTEWEPVNDAKATAENTKSLPSSLALDAWPVPATPDPTSSGEVPGAK